MIYVLNNYRLSASKEAINLDYLNTLRDSILKPLIDEGTDGVQKSLDFMNYHHLVKDDVESLNELSTWPGCKDPMSNIPSKVKSAFTRAYNKSAPTFTVTKKSKKIVDDNEDLLDDDDTNVISEEEEDDIVNDTLISVVSYSILISSSIICNILFNFQVKKKTNKNAANPTSETTKGKGSCKGGSGGRKKK